MQNVMQNLHQNPTKSAVYTLLAEMPTMTNSRAEAMGTGSHTAYIKLATSFQRPRVDEDNIFEQFRNNYIRMVNLGAAIWSELYPSEYFRRLHVKSVMSQIPVDDIIREYIGEEFKYDDWQFLLSILIFSL